MVPVSTAPAPTRNSWTCPTCKHGSPDPRDELAHLDAHRQLGQFLRDWDAAVVSDRKKQRGRRPAVVGLIGVVVIAIVVGGVVFSGLGRTGGSSGHVAGPVPASIVPAPVPAAGPYQPPAAEVPAVSPQVVPADAPPSAPQSPPVAASPDAAAPSATAPAPSAGPADAATIAVPPVPAPTAPGSRRVSTLGSLHDAPAPAPAYLLKLCLIDTCLTIP